MLSVQLKRLSAAGKLTKVKASFKLGEPLKKAPAKPKVCSSKGQNASGAAGSSSWWPPNNTRQPAPQLRPPLGSHLPPAGQEACRQEAQG